MLDPDCETALRPLRWLLVLVVLMLAQMRTGMGLWTYLLVVDLTFDLTVTHHIKRVSPRPSIVERQRDESCDPCVNTNRA